VAQKIRATKKEAKEENCCLPSWSRQIGQRTIAMTLFFPPSHCKEPNILQCKTRLEVAGIAKGGLSATGWD